MPIQLLDDKNTYLANVALTSPEWGQVAQNVATLPLMAAFSQGELMSPLTRNVMFSLNAGRRNNLPGAPDFRRMFLQGLIPDSVYKDGMRIYGYDPWDPEQVKKWWTRRQHYLLPDAPRIDQKLTISDMHMMSEQWAPSIEMILEFLRRNYIKPPAARDFLGLLGIPSLPLRDTILDLATYVPPPQDIIRFAVKEVFNPNLIQRLGLDLELPEDYRFWASISGIKELEVPDGAGDYKTRKLDAAKAYWIAHWQLPSPTQAYEMLHRVRPDNIDRIRRQMDVQLGHEVSSGLMTAAEKAEILAKLKPVTVSDVNFLLKANDYSPPWRAPLTAISYRVITRVDIRRLYQSGDITEEELPSFYQDLGYSIDNAQRLSRFTVKQKLRSAAAGVIRKSKAQIEEAYSIGIIGDDGAKRLLKEHGLTDPEADSALTNIRLDIRIVYVRKAIRIIRGRYLHGAINEEEAKRELERLVLQTDKIRSTLELWALERTGRARELATAQILSAYIEGVIQSDEVILRLTNLGFKRTDIRVLLETAEAKGAKKRAPRRQPNVNGQPVGSVPPPP